MDQAPTPRRRTTTARYDIRETYPLGKWLVLEAFNTRYQTTGITYQGENETTATTKLGSLVDINFLPIIGLGGEIDWGVQPYDAGSQRRHRRHGHLRHDPQRARPRRRRHRGLPAGHPGRAGARCTSPVPCTATTADDIANACRQGHAIVPLKVADTANPGTMVDNPAPDRGALVKGAQVQKSYTSREVAAAARLHRSPVRRSAADRPAGAARVRRRRRTGCASRRR